MDWLPLIISLLALALFWFSIRRVLWKIGNDTFKAHTELEHIKNMIGFDADQVQKQNAEIIALLTEIRDGKPQRGAGDNL